MSSSADYVGANAPEENVRGTESGGDIPTLVVAGPLRPVGDLEDLEDVSRFGDDSLGGILTADVLKELPKSLDDKFSSSIFSGAAVSKKKLKTTGYEHATTNVTKELSEELFSAFEIAALDISIEHEAIQNIIAKHSLKNNQVDRQIKKWKKEKANGWYSGKSKVSIPPTMLTTREASSAVAPFKTINAFLTRDAKDHFIIREVIGEFEETVFKEPVAAINFLHEKGFSISENAEECESWKSLLNSKRKFVEELNAPDALDKQLTVGIFTKRASSRVTGDESPCSPKRILAIFMQANREDQMIYLRGPSDETMPAPFEEIDRAVIAAQRLGYKKMRNERAKFWIKTINDFYDEEDLSYVYADDRWLGWDRVIGVFEK